MTKLDNELSQSREEVNSRQSRINDLKDRIEQVKADKLRAFGEVEELTRRLSRQEEEMEKARLEGQGQLESLQEELVSSYRRSSELEGQVAEAEERVTSLRGQVAEVERHLAILRGEQDATCAEAFQLGEEEVRTKISREHPEWDLSFLDVEPFEACTSGAEETEYEDISDVDLDVILGSSEVTVPEEHSKPAAEGTTTFEVGETSQVSPSVVGDTAGIDPAPDP